MNGVILMVEDNPDDAQLVERQLRYSQLRHTLQVARDGREAVDYLSGIGRFSDRKSFPQPCLLVLDLKLPRLDGFELLEWVRKNPETSHLPVIIYSGSVSPEDAQRAYALGANACFVKLGGAGHYNMLFTAIQEFCEPLTTAS